MSLNFPSNRKEVTDRIKSDVQSQLPQSNPYLRNSFLQALIFGLGGRCFNVYKTIQGVLLQIFWDTCTGEYLKKWASFFGITQNLASTSSGFITLSGTVAAAIPSGTVLQSADGLQYETQTSVAIAAISKTISSLTQVGGVATAVTSTAHNFAPNQTVVIAGAAETDYNGSVVITSIIDEFTFTYSVDAGTATPATGTITASADMASVEVESIDTGSTVNQDAGATLTLVTPIAGVSDNAFVQVDGIQGGADDEDDISLRDRFLFRVKNPVSLFNNNAIINKAREITGVTRVWVQNVDSVLKEITTITGITQTGGIAIITFSAPHGLTTYQKIMVQGAAQAGYNLTGVNCLVIDATHICYIVASGTVSPATGPITLRHSTVEDGQVKVFFTRDNDTVNIPSGSEITDVETAILSIKPATSSDANIIVDAPTAVTVNISIADLLPSTSTLEQEIENNLDAYFREQTEVAVDVLLTAINSIIYQTIDPNSGERVQSFTLTTPAATVTIADDELAVLGTVTFT